jgi:hypothetical protein
VLPVRGNKSLTGIALLLMRLPRGLANIRTMARIDRTTHGRVRFDFQGGLTHHFGLLRFDDPVGQMPFVPI